MTQTAPRLILGSGSPRRLDLLTSMGFQPDAVRAPDIDERPLPGEDPRTYCQRIVRAKADAIAIGEDEVLLVADTTVAVGRRILGKPADEAEARAFLELMSGRRHKVITALAVRTVETTRLRVVVSTVKMKRLGVAEIDAYLLTDDWRGKAGGYAIQGPAARFIPWIQGSHSAIVGLPLAEASALLDAAGVRSRMAA